MAKTAYFTLFALVGALLVYLDVGIRRTAGVGGEEGPSYRVMLLGFDGADPEFLNYLVSTDKLPNFQRLMEEGAYAACQTFKPTKSVVIWTSIATGKRMEKHGIVDWMLLSPDGKKRVMATGNARRTEALWNIASDAGKGVQILNWWATWPVEPVKGEMVSNHFPKSLHREMGEVAYPDVLARELESVLSGMDREAAKERMRAAGISVYSRELAESAFRPSDNFRKRFQTSVGNYHEDMLVDRAAHYLLDTRGQRDLFAVLFRNLDIFSHFMWRFIDRRTASQVFRLLRERQAALTREIDETMNEAYARVLEAVYVHEDRRLGRLMEKAGPDTVVMVVSDHGFQFRNYGFNHYDHGEGGVKAPPGVIFLWGPPVRRNVRLRSPTVFDVAPTALYLMGLPVGRDMDGRVLTEALVPQLFAKRPVAWIPTHDSGRRGGEPRSSPIDEDVLNELKTLGYVR
ncbi:MAG: alkaline phosphatase family protein [Acidobacteriota bacterium]